MSEEVACRLIQELDGNFEIILKFRRNGNGYLKSKMTAFYEIAMRNRFLLLTDLDQARCPSSLISSWLKGRNKPDNLLFRVVVHEIESWLLADHEGMRRLLGPVAMKIADNPDLVIDPKQKLLRLALGASREVREDLVSKSNSIALVGLGYNSRMVEYIRSTWCPGRASSRSPSLHRARERLKMLVGQTR